MIFSISDILLKWYLGWVNIIIERYPGWKISWCRISYVEEVFYQARRTEGIHHSSESSLDWQWCQRWCGTVPLMTQNRKSVREICSNKEELFKIGLETQFSIDSLFSYFPRRKMRKYPIKFGPKTEFIFWNIGTMQIGEFCWNMLVVVVNVLFSIIRWG